MNRKKLYENPEMILVELLSLDILTASDEIGEDEGDNDGEWA